MDAVDLRHGEIALRRLLEFGETTIEYDVTFAERKTLAIDVHPDLQVTVAAPEGTSLAVIDGRVRRRAPWILRQQRELELYLPHTPPKRFVSGETHRYLGRQYRLKVTEGERTWVKLTRGYLHVTTAAKADTDTVRQQVEDWYLKQARRVFQERVDVMLPRFRQLDIATPELTIKSLDARWGSCSDAGVITLNLKLIQVPKPYIDYVIVHELCHLLEHNHSRRFYLLLDRTMPDWHERRKQLNECEVA